MKKSLFEIVAEGDEDGLRKALEAGEERNAATLAHGNTILHEAAWKGFSRCVKLLGAPLKDGTAPSSEFINRVNFCGFSALHLAAQNGHNQTMRELLYASSNPAIHNDYGDTPLHTACRYGHAGAVRILISARCDVDAFNLNHDTPLHITCAMGRRKLTKLLLEASALQFKNLQHETPLDIAKRKNLQEILDILNTFEATGGKKGRNKREESKSPHDNKKPKKWSPYGCHYFPDPRNFPPPKLETLPKEPLLSGEQYFLDLGGKIRKGPVGCGHTCYCAPFFKQLINQKCRGGRRGAHDKLEKEVSQLLDGGDDNSEANKRRRLQKWLKRGVRQEYPEPVLEEPSRSSPLRQETPVQVVPASFNPAASSSPTHSKGTTSSLNSHQHNAHQLQYSQTDGSATTPSLSSNHCVELEMDRITRALLGPDLVQDHQPVTLLPPGDLYVNDFYLHDSEIRSSNIKSLRRKISEEEEDDDIQELVQKVQETVLQSNVCSIQATSSHQGHNYSGGGRIRCPLPMDELEKYTESFFLQPNQDQDGLLPEHSEPHTINGNSFMLLDQLLKARRRHLEIDDNNGISASSLV